MQRALKQTLLLFFACVTLRAGEPVVIYFVRHAEKLDQSADPPLAAAGRARALALAEMLGQLPLNGLFCSPRQRTRLTLEPLAKATGLSVESIPFDASDAFLKRLRQSPGKSYVVCGHSDSLPEMIAKLGGPLLSLGDQDYDGLYLVLLSDGGTIVQKLVQPKPCE